ncbi:MAG: EamA family transporter [Bacteroidetes bacterium]|nr:EamA family transporter [Bacteroidota bacterium]MBU1680651.1 EamA family transporter [Bacteroidota bacterium]MBU2506520.1 EamA family transporter [Bacteroidota bacterium]
MNNENIKIGAGFTLICLLWGSTWLAIRVGLDSLTPIFSAGVRFSLASLFIYSMMRIKGIGIQKDPVAVKLYIIMGIFSFVIPFGLVYWAEQFIQSGLASILFGVFPFAVIIFSRIAIPEDKVGSYKILGVGLGFGGIILIFSEGLSIDFSNDFWGMIAIVISAVMQAVIAVMMKKYGRQLNPLSMNLAPVMIAGAIMVPAGLLFEDTSRLVFDSKAIFSVTYLAFFGTLLTFTTYYWLMRRMNVVILSLSSFITPIVAVILGYLILDEYLTQRHLIGSALVLIGILLANVRGLINYFIKKK